MRVIQSIGLLSVATLPLVHCDWISAYNDFASLRSWYSNNNAGETFNPLRWLGGNGQWFPGPDVYSLGRDPPDDCSVEQAVHILRHGSRHPDPSAYQEWMTLYNKIQNSTFVASGPLSFLANWKTVLTNPSVQLSTESITGYRETFDLATSLRIRYPTFYKPGEPYHVFANDYPRVVESAQSFLRSYLGVNASNGLGTVYAVNSRSEQALGNSLAPSDLCPNYVDSSGTDHTAIWDSISLPPVVKRISKYITSGSLNITTADISTMIYLCGFETSITGVPSPFCSLFNSTEIQDYEYHQDLRYYYGNGPGSTTGKYMMYPFLRSIVGLLNPKYSNATNAATPTPPLILGFLNDGQLSQLVASLGIFDEHPSLPSTFAPLNRSYIASHFVSMRGTVSFERFNCQSSNTTSFPSRSQTYLRLLLNDAPYPLPFCSDGPGSSCLLDKYTEYVQKKYEQIGGDSGWSELCGINASENNKMGRKIETNFWTEYEKLGFVRAVVP